jgi:Starch-binding associating with outer membrane/Susd and RagB outer membrane lipoprotein
VINSSKFKSLAALALLTAAGCKTDFLTGGELNHDPNRPSVASAQQLFAGVQSNLWALWGSDLARVTGMWSQQFQGGISQYVTLYQYAIDENTTGGFQQGLYSGGGLVDLKNIDPLAVKVNDKHLLGTSQIFEGALMGTGADLFGDLVYSQALIGKTNPTLDKQAAVYDSVQKILSAGITNLQSNTATDVGPQSYDLNYGGDPTAWTKFAHTLKARFYMHTAKTNPNAYALALQEVPLGLNDPAIDYKGVFQAVPLAETNFYYQFNGPAGRGGYMVENPFLVNLMASRNDPRLNDYFDTTAAGTNYVSATRAAPNYQQAFVSTTENLLIWAEAAFRTGDPATAIAKLQQYRALVGLTGNINFAGPALLTEILTEEYINDFQLGEETWNLYKRTCFPNLVPTVSTLKIPRRFYYDTGERQTNTNIPAAGSGINGAFNQDDPAATVSDGGNGACLGQ